MLDWYDEAYVEYRLKDMGWWGMMEIPEWVNSLLDRIIPWCEPDGKLKEEAPEEIKKALKSVQEYMAPMEGAM